ncbi:MAG: DUF4957 domain-containing protein, partial [Prevotella sp.]|nr:DUF4957 domain-containing protein [Prevotella sp.]
LLGVGALMLSSCADDGYNDDERWSSSVKNTTLESPSAEDITVTASADGKSQTITWPVVNGAGGYLVSFYDPSAEDSIIADSIVDGCQIIVSREEDMNYVFSIKTLGNEANNNKGAEAPTEYAFTTFMPATAVLPNGTDIYEWSQTPEIQTLLTTPTEETLIFDLEAGGEYALSNIVDFGHNKVILRTASKSDWATITYANGASIRFGGGFILRYMNINGEATTDPILGLSDAPNDAILGQNSHYIINDPVTIQNCYIYNVQRQLLHDNKVKYCIALFTIDNTEVKFTTDGGMSSGSYILIYDGGGFINNFTATNSTFWNAPNKDGELHESRYFVRYNNSGRCDRAGFTYNMINFQNCTFYNIAKSGQMANHGGFDGRATSFYNIQNNIFVDCGGNQVARRIVGRSHAQAEITFHNNTYWYNGAAETGNTSYDTGYQMQSDPAFENAEAGDFTPTGAEQVSAKTGDPRWFE